MYNSVGFIGGDKRQLYCANAFLQDGLKVTISGFSDIKTFSQMDKSDPIDTALKSDFLVLPLPCVKGGYINAPFSKEKIKLSSELMNAMSGKKIFCGIKEKLICEAPVLKDFVYDFSDREEFAIYNAVATAEGALEIALREFEGTISHSKVLVCGYGRIGKVLTDMLISLNADVTVSARKLSDLAFISTKQCKGVKTSSLGTLSPFDIIFNTVPALVFDAKTLSHVAKNALVIDLASVPGGVDFTAASRMDICTIHALSLPGKSAPKTAGEIIKDTITNMLEEDDRCQKPA